MVKKKKENMNEMFSQTCQASTLQFPFRDYLQ